MQALAVPVASSPVEPLFSRERSLLMRPQWYGIVTDLFYSLTLSKIILFLKHNVLKCKIFAEVETYWGDPFKYACIDKYK